MKNKFKPEIKKETDYTIALKECELLFSNAHDMIYTLDKDGKIKSINKYGITLLEYPENELIGNPFLDYIYKDDKYIREKYLNNIQNNKKISENYSLRLITKSGKLIWVSINSILYYNEKNNIIIEQGICRDITEHKNRAINLKEQKEYLDVTLKSISEAVITTDINGNILFMNNAAEQITGYKFKNVEYSPIDEIIKSSNRKNNTIIKSIKNVINTGKESRKLSVNIVDAKDKTKVITKTVAPIRDYNSNIIGTVLVLKDITETYTKDIALTESENKYRNLIERANDGICIIQDKLITFSNKKLSDIIGYSQKEIINTSFMNYLHPDEKDKVVQRYIKRIHGEKIEPIYESKLLNKNGQAIPVEINAGLIQYNEKEADLVLIRDITDRKKNEEKIIQINDELIQANIKLRDLDKLKNNFISNISHELRTPLVAIQGYTELILNNKSGPVTEKQEKQLKIILQSVQKLVVLIENLLDFSRLELGKEKLFLSEININNLLDDTVHTFDPLFMRKKINIKKYFPKKIITITGDTNKLFRVISNLLDNAIKFTHNNGTIVVKLLQNKKENNIQIIISDNGIGIPENKLDDIFKKFYQIDSSSTRQFLGTGIGLSICKDIIELHNGNICVDSKKNEGATFTITLPVEQP